MMNPTERFSSRVENYVRYRPHYPPAVLETLRAHCQLTAASVIADVGSGTGILTELFLRNGNVAYGIEPNREMRAAGERLLHSYPRFHSIAATAEAITLTDASVDFVTAGQAFHWFDAEKAKAEFKRILKPQGWGVLVWNEWREASTPFGLAYEQLLRDYATDYPQVDHKRSGAAALNQFFGSGFGRATFENGQHFDWEGLRGRLLSSSYAPEAGHPRHEDMLAELRQIFEAHQVSGTVAFDYATNLYYGQF